MLSGSLSVSPVVGSLIEMRGRRSAARDSMMTLRERPVTSSSFSVIVTPSTMSPNFTMPPTSLRIGIGERVPLREELARLHLVALVDLEQRAVHEAMVLALAAGVVDEDDLAVAVHDDDVPSCFLRDVRVADAHVAFVARLERALLDLAARRRAADVERPHRELRARLADRLARDDADRLADVDLVAAREIAPVALGAHAALASGR